MSEDDDAASVVFESPPSTPQKVENKKKSKATVEHETADDEPLLPSGFSALMSPTEERARPGKQFSQVQIMGGKVLIEDKMNIGQKQMQSVIDGDENPRPELLSVRFNASQIPGWNAFTEEDRRNKQAELLDIHTVAAKKYLTTMATAVRDHLATGRKTLYDTIRIARQDIPPTERVKWNTAVAAEAKRLAEREADSRHQRRKRDHSEHSSSGGSAHKSQKKYGGFRSKYGGHRGPMAQ